MLVAKKIQNQAIVNVLYENVYQYILNKKYDVKSY